MRVASRRMLAPQHRTMLTAAAYNLAKKQMPKMSETEKIALGAGTVNLFFCKPPPRCSRKHSSLKTHPKIRLALPRLPQVGFDRDIFGGSPPLQHLLDTTRRSSAEEQSFLDNEVEEPARCSTTTRSRPTRT